MHASRTAFLLGVCLSIVSCGGGGGGGGGSSQSGIPFDYSGIAADLQTEDPVRVAASILRGADKISTISGTLDEGELLAAAANNPRYLWNLVLDAYRLQTSVAAYQGTALPAVSVGPETDNCTYGGSVTVSADIANPDLFLSGVLVTGDRFFSDFSDCSDVPEETLDGGFDFRILSFIGNYNDPDYDMSLQLDLDRFRYTKPGNSVLYDGSIKFELTQGIGLDVNVITGDSLVYRSDGITYAQSNLSQMYTVENQSYTLSGSGMMESTLVTGELGYAVVVPLRGVVDNPPTSGEVQVRGKNGGGMYMTVLPGGIVRLEIDTDGLDGNETTLEVSWEQLYAVVPD